MTSQANLETASEAPLVELERRVLQALCDEGVAKKEREIARRGLASHRWREPAHEAIFEVIVSFPSTSSQALREQVPARLTRRGFPDFDFDSLFDPLDFAPEEFERLIRSLEAANEKPQNESSCSGGL